MIKKEEYLKALDIVEQYHREFKRKIYKDSFENIKNLSQNDFVRCIALNNNTKQCLTLNKEYQILKFNNHKTAFFILDDNNVHKWYSAITKGTFESAI